MNQHEWRFQEAAYAYLKKALPPHALVWGVDHAGRKTKAQRLGNKARGMIAGIHDLFAWCDAQLMTFELKAGKNDVTATQEEFARGVFRNGGRSFACWKLEDIEAGLIACGFKPLAHLTAAERDAMLSARPVVRKASNPRATKPSPSRVRKVAAIMGRYLPPEPVFTGVKKG